MSPDWLDNLNAVDSALVDTFGRRISDLRLSVTDRCNFRCVYCTDPGVRYEDPDRLLSIEEMVRVARVGSQMGINKVRITGGEPTLRPGLDQLFAGLSELALDDIAMTTNGSLVTRETARLWKAAGLKRLTISIDSLKPERFGTITRSTCTVEQILQAIEVSQEEGLGPVRINAVIIRGMNEDEIVDLARLSRRFGVDVRMIEYMPLDAGRSWSRGSVVTADEMTETISAVFPLESVDRDTPSSPSQVYRFADGYPGRVGVIASVTRSFCDSCSRIRLTSDGMLRTCLFGHDEWDIRPVLRKDTTKAGDLDVARFLARVVKTKPEGHIISSTQFVQPTRSMSAIGG